MDEQDIRRKLATIMVADIVGFSRQTALDEDWTIHALADFRRVVDEIIARHDGRIFNTGGDSVLAEFASPVEAVRAAVDFQEAARSRNLLRPRDKQLRFRIGINLGDVMARGTDLLGDGVNVAARLEGLAEPGGICVSGSVWDHIQGKLSIGYVDIGEQTVKNIPRPIRAYHLRVDSTIEERGMSAQPSHEPRPNGETSLASTPNAPIMRNHKRGRGLPVAFVAALALILALAWGAWQFWQQRNETAGASFIDLLSEQLASAVPAVDQQTRDDMARFYVNTAIHKALAASFEPPGLWSKANQRKIEEAETAVLESCQIIYGRPCALLALDDHLQRRPADGKWPLRDMPNTHYSGDFDPAQIPALTPGERVRIKNLDYPSLPSPKAAAFQPSGRSRSNTLRKQIFESSGARSQRAAEEEALKFCNDDMLKNFSSGACFLYAIGNHVVLPLRLKEPLTAPTQETPASR